MAYVITDPCIDETDQSCVDECPVDCIYEGDRMMYINPDECVDCGRCEPVCPVISIFHEEDVPADRAVFIEINEQFFATIGSPGGARKIGPVGADHPAVTEWAAT
ncbi:ferredoxin [Rhodococcus sp. X156]|uniref:ferredoxin n=1 Tax=Rhodococcus sp. X156 TaxID=2499145 RepID=UPI001F49A1F9|nr:ferredoxin [Rhodococcus sp. X156]